MFISIIIAAFIIRNSIRIIIAVVIVVGSKYMLYNVLHLYVSHFAIGSEVRRKLQIQLTIPL